MKNKVSAIITTHNRKELLKRAIESVLNQTYNYLECIVVDDKSNDGTDLLCKEYPIQYIYISSDESKGGNYARNKGIKAAKGEYIAFLDDDDYWLPNKIEKQMSLIESKGCELVYCGRILEIVKNNEVSYIDLFPNESFYGDMSKKILQTICCTTTSNILASRKALFDVGLFDEDLKFWQEYELTIRLAQRKPFYFVNELLTVYRVDKSDKNRLTNKYYAWIDAVKYIHKKHQILYKKLSKLEYFKVNLLICYDAIPRCKSSGLVGHYIFYQILTFPFTLIRSFLKIFK